jgi:hypothetical protein
MEPRASIRNFRPCYLVCALLLLAITSCARDQLIFPRNPIELPADGRTHTVATITRRSGRPLKTISIESASPDVRFLQQTDHTLAVLVRAPVQPSDSRLHFTWRDRRYTLNVHYVPSDSDMFHDGLPDALHLHSTAPPFDPGSSPSPNRRPPFPTTSSHPKSTTAPLCSVSPTGNLWSSTTTAGSLRNPSLNASPLSSPSRNTTIRIRRSA